MLARSGGCVAVLGCLCFAVLGGCAISACAPRRTSPLPEFARPQRMTGIEDVLTGDVISYRTLTRDDFRALHPPPNVGANAEHMGAVTCAMIKTRPGAQFVYSARGDDIEVRVESLEFEALMDRGCSWWNDDREVFSDTYVLEHEQIHLAFFEVEARRLTRRAARATISPRRGATPEELAGWAQLMVDREVEAAAQAVLERSLRFDEDTSIQLRPELQGRWLEAVERELRELPR